MRDKTDQSRETANPRFLFSKTLLLNVQCAMRVARAAPLLILTLIASARLNRPIAREQRGTRRCAGVCMIDKPTVARRRIGW
jgi:hypothetical protein